MTINVDVISDVICPWCFIGKRRLESAIAALVKVDPKVKVRWHPFELNPNMPKEGIRRSEYRIAKFGSWERSTNLDAQVAEAGRDAEIIFAFDKIARTPNTRDAHRLLWLADRDHVQDAVMEAIFRAYFVEAQDISQMAVLIDVVARAGLSRDRAACLLNGDDGLAAVLEAENHARRIGVQGVPHFVINGTIPLSGAREPEAFLEAFRLAELTSTTTD